MGSGPRVLVTGATGYLGQALVPRLQAEGCAVRATSRDPSEDGDAVEWVAMDLADGSGIEAAVEDQSVVVHCASAAFGDTEAVDVEGTRQLLDAAEAGGVEHFVYISIVGIDDIPFAYYEAKRRAESFVEASGVPATILRSTQFFPFLGALFGRLRWVPVWPLPSGMPLQPIAVEDVADAVVETALDTPAGRLDPIGGPEVQTVGELARTYRSTRGWWRPVVGVPYPGGVVSAFRSGAGTCPDHRYGEQTWAAWLGESA